MRADKRPDVFDTVTLTWVRVFHLARESPPISTSTWIPVNVMNASGNDASREDENLSPRCSKSWSLLAKTYSKQHNTLQAQNSLPYTSPDAPFSVLISTPTLRHSLLMFHIRIDRNLTPDQHGIYTS
jgi:hypothetical protein